MRAMSYPCLCLCFWLAQMTRTTPWRRTTLHLTQIFFTEERTFMRVLAPTNGVSWILAPGRNR